MLLPLALTAAPPGWWSSRGVTPPNSTPNDYAVANQGQLKFIAKQAAAEMDANLPGGAGDAVHALVAGWATPTAQSNDFAPVNLGMLKTVAAPFYDQLILAGYTGQYPWLASTAPANDYAAANLGQVKNLFSFELTRSTAQDGVPDWWKVRYYGAAAASSGAAAASANAQGGSGLTNLQDYQLGLNPMSASTVGDGIPDGWKVTHGIDPHDASAGNQDPDGDGLTNSEEYHLGTDPQNPDTDGDGIPDGLDLYPLIQNPSAPPNVRVAVPSYEQQQQQPQPDYTKVDYTAIEVRWDASDYNPTGYKVQRRENNGPWHDLPVPGSTTSPDQGLVANRHYQYRVTAVTDQGNTHIESSDIVVDYEVPLGLNLLVKRSSLSRSKSASSWIEFTNQNLPPSTPPKYYLVRQDSSSYQERGSYSDNGSPWSYSKNGQSSFNQAYAPSQHTSTYDGSYNYDTSYSGSGSSGGSYSSQSSDSAATYWNHQGRGKGHATETTQANGKNNTYYSSNSTSGDGSNSSSSGGSGWDGTYLLNGLYQASSGQPMWMGHDFDLPNGNVTYSGNSTYNYSNGNISYVASATAGTSSSYGYPTWTGTGTHTYSDGTTDSSKLTGSAWSDARWWYFGQWSGTLTGTTHTQMTYASNGSPSTSSWNSNETVSLSQEYNTKTFIQDTVNDLPDYPKEWTNNYYGWGYYDWGYWDYNYWGYWGGWYNWGYPWYGWWLGQQHLDTTQNYFSVDRITYKLQANPSASETFTWYEVFVPDDDLSTPDVDESKQIVLLNKRTWTLSSGQNESPEYEIDPSKDQRRNGYYTILIQPVHIGVPEIGEAGKDLSGQISEPGRVMLVNDGDVDSDGIPDYADGYNLNGVANDQDDTCWGNTFTPLGVGMAALDPKNAKIRFTYDASDPKQVVVAQDAFGNPTYTLPQSGTLRLWMKDSAQRDGKSVKDGGDYVVPGVEYTCKDLGIDSYQWLELYAEAVKASAGAADIPVKIEVDPTGSSGYVWSDEVRFTAVKINPLKINQQGATAPINGVLVKKGVPLQMALTGTMFGQDKHYGGLLTWKSRQLKGDGTFTDWRIIGMKNTNITYAPFAGGIFQVKASLSSDGTFASSYYARDYQHVRLSDTAAANITDSFGHVSPDYAKGQPDYVGVADEDWQIAVRNNASGDLGTTKYAQSSSLPAYGARSAVPAKSNKCNVFVYDKSLDAGLKVPTHFKAFSRTPLSIFVYYPYLAYELWNLTTTMPNWYRCPDGTLPQPGFVVAGPETDRTPPSGHAGVLDYDGAWINAGKNSVNKYPNRIRCDKEPYSKQAFRRYVP